MTAPTLTLASFLLARIAEDEAAVQRGPLGPSRTVDGEVAPWSSRVLAECEAKRQIVALHQPHEEDVSLCSLCGHIDEFPFDWPCDTLCLLALPYADHADYDERWRP